MKENHTAATGTVCNRKSSLSSRKSAPSSQFHWRERDQRWRHRAAAPQTDLGIGLTKALARAARSARARPGRIRCWRRSAMAHGLVPGHKTNDHDTLRHDLAWQKRGTRPRLASSPTLCRLENRADRYRSVHAVLVHQFIASFAPAPAELILILTRPMTGAYGRSRVLSWLLRGLLFSAAHVLR